MDVLKVGIVVAFRWQSFFWPSWPPLQISFMLAKSQEQRCWLDSDLTVREVTVHAAESVCGAALASCVKHANDIISIARDH